MNQPILIITIIVFLFGCSGLAGYFLTRDDDRFRILFTGIGVLLGPLFLLFALGGFYIARRYEKSKIAFTLIGLFTGPVGLLFIFILIKLPEKFVSPFIAVSVFLLLSLTYSQTTLLSGLEWGSIDFRFYLRDPSQKSEKLQEGVRLNKLNPRARKDIIIAGIDENTFREFSNNGINWPYPWRYHAKFTNYVASGNPLAIFFDIMFIDHQKLTCMDSQADEKLLEEAIKKAGNVYLDYPFENDEVDVGYTDIEERMKLLGNMRFPVDPADNYEEFVKGVTPPLPALIKAARGIGFANVFQGRDGINRTVPLIIKYKGWYYPNIDLVVIMHYYGIGQKDVEIKIGQYIKLKNLPPEKMAKPNNEREIKIPIDENGFMDINFIGGTGSFQHIPYYYFVQDGDMKGNDSLKDKIVLVAAYAVTGVATDEKKSPYGPAFGIEHHANAINTVLTQDFLYKLTDWQNMLIMLVIAIMLGLVIPRMSIVASLASTLLFVICCVMAAYLIFEYKSIITAFSTPMIQTILTYTLIVTYRVVNEQQEKKYIRQTFSKFVSKSVVDELLQDPSKVKLGGEKKILSVLFSDIRGFTSISEILTPEELVEHLNIYLQAMTDIVINTGGTLDKYIGDAIMAFWGAPIELENHALKSCEAALQMMEKMAELNKVWEHEGKPILDIGIGINSGDMVVGNMGSSSRMDYTLMGDNVNLGSRLEGTNKVYHTNIIISDFTYQYVKEHVIVRELDLIRVKGKALPVKIYELMGLKD